MKRKSLLAFVVLVSLLGLPQSVTAQSFPEPGPLNPAFNTYLKQVNSDTINTSSQKNLGLIPEPLLRSQSTQPAEISASLPETFDLRKTGRISPVYNQGEYGTCWSFATMESLESYLMPEAAWDFSENNLVWNHGYDWDAYDAGNAYMAMAYFARYDGPVAEADDPYGSIPSTGQDVLYHIQAVEMLPNDPNTIKQSIMEGGTVTTSIRVASEFYVAENNALYYSGTDSPNHAVAIVGWDDHFDKNLFANTPEDDGAWIIQNSWGEDSGEYGFFYLSYYDTYSGNDVTAFHNAEATNNYGQVYQYDYLGTTNTLSYYHAHTPSAWGANIFTPSDNQNLTAISSYAVNFNTDLEISIYTGLTDKNNPQSGKLVATQSAHFDNMGYYTIPLNTPVILTAFEPYSVVIEYSSPGNAPAVPVESPLKGYSSAAWAHPGESFITDDGKEDMVWTDVSADNTNVCIKAFTEYSETASNSINCAYRTHVENSGWEAVCQNGETSGSTGQGLRLEGIQIQLDAKNYDLSLSCRTHIENKGWQNWSYDGAVSGSTGEGLRLEALELLLSGSQAELFDVYYRVHAQNLGWMGWAKNGESAGSQGLGYRLEAIEIQVVPKDTIFDTGNSPAFIHN